MEKFTLNGTDGKGFFFYFCNDFFVKESLIADRKANQNPAGKFPDTGLRPDRAVMSDLFEVTISDVSITNVGFAIFLKPVESESVKVVPIFIGPLETYSISSALDGVTPPRPNTHDLIINMLREMDSRVLHVVINDIIGNIFYARIVIQSEDGIIEMDARPSDSVAVAIRARCPIYMNEKVYREAAVVIGEESPTSELQESQEEEFSSEGKGGEYATPETRGESRPGSELERLKSQLQTAVETENFEEAARLRDEINRLLHEN